MEKSSFAMAKFGLEGKEALPKRDCGFYVKYIFLFTSLIQFLIILGLVLFMVYGNAQAGTHTHLKVLEREVQERYNKYSLVSQRNTNLSRALNATIKEKQGLQGQLQKVKQDLEKCNSTQNPNPVPKEMLEIMFYQKMSLDSCHATVTDINSTCNKDKAALRTQLEQRAQAEKELEQNCRKTNDTLSEARKEQKSCQQVLNDTRTLWESTRTNLGLLKDECRTLRSDVSYTFQRIKELLGPYTCGSVQEQLSWLTQQAERLFLWQQDRETKYVGKSVCDMNLFQSRLNCSREKQELEKKLRDSEKEVKGGEEERKKLLLEKEKLGKELEEKSKAAAQVGHLWGQLNLCLNSKMGAFFDIPGLRAPAGGGTRPGPFPNAGSYMDALSQGIFGNMGKPKPEELQQFAQKMLEQFLSPQKNPSG
ncbi:plasmalemma vesicle-associated protein [Heliangelus exortis]|uniref:plasmalemma vesicle-associated protein n=1 Tax=Heliangelus exortis TaxID=472823 RepID=UPI003A953DDE